MLFIPPLLLLIVILVGIVLSQDKVRALKFGAGFFVGALVLTAAVFGIDNSIQTSDTEIWSGKVVDWEHKEEWDEWHPPKENCSTDSKGKRSCTTTPGYWEHHKAENRIKTTDAGWIDVDKTPDGKKDFNDSWPNKTEELKAFWKPNEPSASTHSFTNNVKASYSIFKHKDIDLEKFKDLPEYPLKVEGEIKIKRILGDVPNKADSIAVLDHWNTNMNKMVTGKDGKKRNWKQVNLIFVNVGADKPEEYGYALQDKWQNGKKNDFVVSFSMNKDGKLNWVYPFSWSEVERLKIDVREMMMQKENITDFKQIVDETANLVIDKFERKEFKDFNYLQVETSTTATIIIWVLNLGLLIGFIFVTLEIGIVRMQDWRP